MLTAIAYAMLVLEVVIFAVVWYFIPISIVLLIATVVYVTFKENKSGRR